MKIKEIIRNIIEVKNDDLSFLNIGDIIWAKRYKTEEEKNKFQKGHQESPHVIIKKEKNKVYALQCTSNPHQEVKWKLLYYPLYRLNYNINKNTYISCLTVSELKEVQYIEMIGHLNNYDLNQLKKQLYIIINSDFKIKPNIEEKHLDFKIDVGDIILYNGIKYYIYSSNKKEYETYRLRNLTKKDKSVLINNTYYSFIFEDTKVIKKKEKYQLIDTFNSGEIIKIEQFKEEYLKDLKNKVDQRKSIIKKELKVGAIIDYKDKMFYIYDENEEKIFFYRIFFNSEFQKGMADILVKNGIYNTFFNKGEIEKEKLMKIGYKVRRYASEKEIKYNNDVSNLPKKERIKKRKERYYKNLLTRTQKNDDLVPMVIVKNQNNNKYYLIISKEENIIEIVNINDMGEQLFFELEEENCPFKFYRILPKEEFDIYLKKIQELKDLVATFNTQK